MGHTDLPRVLDQHGELGGLLVQLAASAEEFALKLPAANLFAITFQLEDLLHHALCYDELPIVCVVKP